MKPARGTLLLALLVVWEVFFALDTKVVNAIPCTVTSSGAYHSFCFGIITNCAIVDVV